MRELMLLKLTLRHPHPNIIWIYDVKPTGSVFYVIMQVRRVWSLSLQLGMILWSVLQYCNSCSQRGDSSIVLRVCHACCVPPA
jgi:hypothetical protein